MVSVVGKGPARLLLDLRVVPFWDRSDPDWIAVAMGAFDGPTETSASLHIYVADRGDYYQLADGLPQYDTVQPRD